MTLDNSMKDCHPDNTGRIQVRRDGYGQFLKGVSGNPAGRPRGSLNRSTFVAQSLLDGQAEALTQKVIDLALEGDTTALKLALERILPPRKDTYISFELQSMNQPSDLVKAVGSVLDAISKGEITPSEGQAITSILEQMRRSLETQELHQKVEYLEALIQTRG